MLNSIQFNQFIFSQEVTITKALVYSTQINTRKGLNS